MVAATVALAYLTRCNQSLCHSQSLTLSLSLTHSQSIPQRELLARRRSMTCGKQIKKEMMCDRTRHILIYVILHFLYSNNGVSNQIGALPMHVVAKREWGGNNWWYIHLLIRHTVGVDDVMLDRVYPFWNRKTKLWSELVLRPRIDHYYCRARGNTWCDCIWLHDGKKPKERKKEGTKSWSKDKRCPVRWCKHEHSALAVAYRGTRWKDDAKLMRPSRSPMGKFDLPWPTGEGWGRDVRDARDDSFPRADPCVAYVSSICMLELRELWPQHLASSTSQSNHKDLSPFAFRHSLLTPHSSLSLLTSPCFDVAMTSIRHQHPDKQKERGDHILHSCEWLRWGGWVGAER